SGFSTVADPHPADSSGRTHKTAPPPSVTTRRLALDGGRRRAWLLFMSNLRSADKVAIRLCLPGGLKPVVPVPVTADVCGAGEGSEVERQAAVEELPGVVVFAEGVAVGEEDAVAKPERNVA